jgi:hypothetical protein
MKQTECKSTGLTRTLSLIGLMVACSFDLVQAAPPPSAFGVWSRGGDDDVKDLPFVRGAAVDASWADVEKQPGVFDWSRMDQAVERAHRDKPSWWV